VLGDLNDEPLGRHVTPSPAANTKDPRVIEIAWRAQCRLHHRWQLLAGHRRKPAAVVAIACARELAAPYVMEQVGHEDQDTTNRIYRHLIRQRQQHGSAFDRVVSDARQAFGSSAPGHPFLD
jgi:hypothetical protein